MRQVYEVVYDEKDQCFRIAGPTKVNRWFLARQSADEHAADLNMAYIAGGNGIEINSIRYDVTIEAVADAYSEHIEQVTAEQIMGRSRLMHRVAARQLVASIMRTEMRMPLMDIGRILGLHHASVIYAVRKCASNLEVDDRLRKVREAALRALRDVAADRLSSPPRGPGNA